MIYLRHNPQFHTVTTYYKSRTGDTLFPSQGTAVFPPECEYLVLGFGFHHYDEPMDVDFVKQVLDKHVGVIYLCTRLPKNHIVHDRLVYVATDFRWFTYLAVQNPTIFKATFSNDVKSAKANAKAFATHFGFQTPVLKSVKDLPVLKEISQSIGVDRICLIETHDGLGDILMSLPSAKTIHSQGWKVHYLVEPNHLPILDNLPFIERVYTDRGKVPMHLMARYTTLTCRLSAYALEFNQQHRIYSSAHLCGLSKEDLVERKPTIILNKAEKQYAKTLLKPYKRTVGIGWYAVGSNRSYFKDYTQRLCDLLTEADFTPVILGTQKNSFENCVDLTRQTNIRQLFAVVNKLDYIITVDTGILHVAGALDKPTIALMGPIPAEWRCSTYKNCYPMTPDVPCYPCADGQWMPYEKRKCKTAESFCLRTITPEKVMRVLKKIHRGGKKWKLKY